MVKGRMGVIIISTSWKEYEKIWCNTQKSAKTLIFPGKINCVGCMQGGRIHWAVYYTSPYNGDFLFVGLTTLGTFFEF